MHKIINCQDCQQTKKQKIVLFAGNFPLIYNLQNMIAEADTQKWGAFSEYSLELAARIGNHAKQIGKEIKFAFFADDHSYEPKEKSSSTKTARHNFFKKSSENNAELMLNYKKILNYYGFSEKDIIKQNQNKYNRENCLYFSEKILRSSKRIIQNPCAREYVEFIENPRYFNKQTDYLISFIPNRCSSNICNYALDIHIKDIESSHIFMQTDTDFLELLNKKASKEDIWIWGVNYRKDSQ